MVGIKKNISRKLLLKLAGQKTKFRNFQNFTNSKDILVAWDENQNLTDKKFIQDFLEFLSKHGKNVFRVIYHHKKKLEIASNDPKLTHLSKTDFNIFGMPKTITVKKLIAHQFDYFINLNLDGRLPLKAIACFTNATCRIGHTRDHAADFYEIMIGKADDLNIEHFIDELKKNLQKFN